MRTAVRSAPGARPSAVLAAELLSAPATARVAVGSKETVRRRLRRQKRGVQPTEPSTLQDIDLPEQFRTTGEANPLQDIDLPEQFRTTGEANPDEFLVHDSGPTSQKRMLVFASRDQLRHLASSDR